MVSFEDIWLLLYRHGASEKKREGTMRFWQTLTGAQQEQVFTSISSKLAENRFVQYDPIRAITENLRIQNVKVPTNLNGSPALDRLIKTTPLVCAKYGNEFGVYTLEEAQLHNMPIARGVNFKYTPGSS